MADYYNQQSQQRRDKNEYYSGRATDEVQQEPYDPRLGPAYGESQTKRSTNDLYHDSGDDFLDQRAAGHRLQSQSTVFPNQADYWGTKGNVRDDIIISKQQAPYYPKQGTNGRFQPQESMSARYRQQRASMVYQDPIQLEALADQFDKLSVERYGEAQGPNTSRSPRNRSQRAKKQPQFLLNIENLFKYDSPIQMDAKHNIITTILNMALIKEGCRYPENDKRYIYLCTTIHLNFNQLKLDHAYLSLGVNSTVSKLTMIRDHILNFNSDQVPTEIKADKIVVQIFSALQTAYTYWEKETAVAPFQGALRAKMDHVADLVGVTPSSAPQQQAPQVTPGEGPTPGQYDEPQPTEGHKRRNTQQLSKTPTGEQAADYKQNTFKDQLNQIQKRTGKSPMRQGPPPNYF